MSTREAIYKTALEHIKGGSDAVCTECGWMGSRRDCMGGYDCPECGDIVSIDSRHMAAYALAQSEKVE